MKVDKYFWLCNRYYLDFGLCSFKNGFARVVEDTENSNYGMWVNPFNLKIVTYREGNIYVFTAEDEVEFVMVVNDYQLDCGCNGDLEEKLSSLGLSILKEVLVC